MLHAWNVCGVTAKVPSNYEGLAPRMFIGHEWAACSEGAAALRHMQSDEGCDMMNITL